MPRRAVVLVALLASTRAPADPCVTPPKHPALRAMAVELRNTAASGDEEWKLDLLAAAPGSEFPAVSRDGRTLVELFDEGEDFTGAPITTLVFWSRSGAEVARYRLGGARSDAPGPAARAGDQKLVAAANARLSRTTWRPLAMHGACDGTPPGSTLRLDGGVTLQFRPSDGRMTIARGAHRPGPLRTVFPASGRRDAVDGGGPCGQLTGFDFGFGGPRVGIAVVVPTAQLGGDSCIGLPSSDTAAVIRLR